MSPKPRPYIIQEGDTLYQIAQMFQVTMESILEANPSIDPNFLRVAVFPLLMLQCVIANSLSECVFPTSICLH